MYLAIDLGGTKTLVAVLSPDGEIIQTTKFPSSHDYQQFLKDLAVAVQQLELKDKPFACCMGVAGLIDRQQGIVFALGNLPWQNEHIRDDVATILGGTPVLIENDAKVAGISEARLLRSTYADVLFLTIGTGIGGAMLHAGQLVKELQDAEMGKIPLFFEGNLTQWEEFAGGRGIVARFGKKAMDIDDPESWEIIGTNLAYGVGVLCSVLQPEALVFGGGVGVFADKFSGTIKDYLQASLHAVVRQPKALLTAQRPEEAVIYGCYELAKDHHASLAH